jgi:2,3-bisphosphoglycerate-independent phosphoglycerate mutase
MLDLARAQGVSRVYVHAFLDGRDTPPRSAESSLRQLSAHCAELSRRGNASSSAERVSQAMDVRIVSVIGRYFAMDRDQRWERVEAAWKLIVDGASPFAAISANEALEMAYARGENDEFVQATGIGQTPGVQDGDVVLFMNFRADRARALSQAFTQADFKGFSQARKPALNAFVTLTEYAKSLDVSAVAFPPQSMQDTLPELLAARGLTQLRIAETEKYAHVTFFFNGGVEAPFAGEERILVPSPKVATYDLQPEMSCPEVTKNLVDAIHSQRFDLLICNIANPDMVGHTGIFAAAVKAVEAVDVALGKLEAAILAVDGTMLVTADHGNLEEMWDANSNQPNTQHSMNPVPFVLVTERQRSALRPGGALSDVAPTILELLNVPKPAAMTGQSLLSA